ncbi:hypothetical protein [Azospirillum brasilense]|uniref:hypothetical protein n=1 Tax=Azospirillum brasilense TaxID=192 RepID=UPI000E6A3C24|nr:hypothetical protein [Azospirillum brasilense]NUB23349.1 hypothetical protein [Azospirillum brasilense]NUB30971.1 hypothetical protein [Azospirillum brasilense]RIW05648.1 hypothetical protein D2T81_07325 [Azospirillum brasilense]
MAIELRHPKTRDRVKVYRTAYDPVAKRGKANFIGSMPNGATAIPDSILVQLSDDERADMEAKMGLTKPAPATDEVHSLDGTIAALMSFAEVAAEMPAADRERLMTAMKAVMAALDSVQKPRPKGVISMHDIDYIERKDGHLTVLEDDGADPFAIPVPTRKAAAGEEVYGAADDGRIVAKVVVADEADVLPRPSDFIRAKAADRYPGIDLGSIVAAWHESIRPNAERLTGKSQADIDQEFIFSVPRLVAASIRAKLPSGNKIGDYADEAERLSWEDSVAVTAEQLWQYVCLLEGRFGDHRTPVSVDLLTDLRAYLGQ